MKSKKSSSKTGLTIAQAMRENQLNQPYRSYEDAMRQVAELKAARQKSLNGREQMDG